MKPPKNFQKIVNRRRYSTATAQLLAGDDYWDGSNYERHGRNTFLYKTQNGAYFRVTLTRWEGEHDTLTPLTESEAVDLYEKLPERRVSYAEAFPNVTIQDA